MRRSRPDAVVFNLQFATFGDKKIPGGLGLLAPLAIRYLTRTPVLVILHNLADNVDMQDALRRVQAECPAHAAGRPDPDQGPARRRPGRGDHPRYVEQLEKGYGARNVLLAPHGSFTETPVPSFTAPAGPRRILAFGKWAPTRPSTCW